jgi:hypothetical protein
MTSPDFTLLEYHLSPRNWSQYFRAFTDYKSAELYALSFNNDQGEGRNVDVSKFYSNLTDVEEATFQFHKHDSEAPTIIQKRRNDVSLHIPG